MKKKLLLENLLVFLTVALLPTQLGRHFFFSFSFLSGVRVDYLAPTFYLSDALILLLSFFYFKPILTFLRNKKKLFILLILFVPVIFSSSFILSIYIYCRLLEVVFLFLIIRSYLSTNRSAKLRLIFRAFLIGAGVEFTLAIIQFLNHGSLQGIFYFLGERSFNLSTPGIAKASLQGVEFLRPYGTFSHPNSLGGFYLLILIFASHSRKTFLSLIATLLIFLSFSKIVIGTFLLLSVIKLFSESGRSNCNFCLFSKIAVLLVVGAVFLTVHSDPATVAKRITLDQQALVIILAHPAVGVGPGTYLLAGNSFTSHYRDLLNQPVHNIFLLWLAEFGLIPTAVVLFVIINNLKKMFLKEPYLCTAIIITGFFDHYWLTLHQNMLLIGVLAAVYSFSSWRRIS